MIRLFEIIILAAAVMFLSGCVPTNFWGVSTDSMKIALDQTVAVSQSEKEIEGMLGQILRVDTGYGFYCNFDFEFNEVSGHKFSDTSLHLRQGEHEGQLLYIQLITDKSSYLPPTGWFCHLDFLKPINEPGEDPKQWPEPRRHTRVAIGASLFHALGMDIPEQYQQPASEGSFYPVAKWFKKHELAEQAVAKADRLRTQQQELAALQSQQAEYEERMRQVIKKNEHLPLELRRDKYMISLTGNLKEQNYSKALFYLDLLDRLNVELSPSIHYFWGEALLKTSQPKKAASKLYDYIEQAGAEGKYYHQALALVNQAEEQF